MDLLEDGVNGVFCFRIEDSEVDLQMRGSLVIGCAFGMQLTAGSGHPWYPILGKVKPEDPELFGAVTKTIQVRASHDGFNSFHIRRLPEPTGEEQRMSHAH